MAHIYRLLVQIWNCKFTLCIHKTGFSNANVCRVGNPVFDNKGIIYENGSDSSHSWAFHSDSCVHLQNRLFIYQPGLKKCCNIDNGQVWHENGIKVGKQCCWVFYSDSQTGPPWCLHHTHVVRTTDTRYMQSAHDRLAEKLAKWSVSAVLCSHIAIFAHSCQCTDNGVNKFLQIDKRWTTVGRFHSEINDIALYLALQLIFCPLLNYFRTSSHMIKIFRHSLSIVNG